jgi:DNA-directed RNA polymerase specialized sigma24 family protein
VSARGNAVPDFAQFVTARYPALVRYGTLLTGDRGHGEDLTQESLVKTHRAWRRLHPDGDPEAYTRQVMARAAWRSDRRLRRGDTSAGGTVLTALRALPAAQRVVLVLHYWSGLSESEIAVALGRSTATVRSHAGRAVDALRRSGGPLAEAFVRTGSGAARG